MMELKRTIDGREWRACETGVYRDGHHVINPARCWVAGSDWFHPYVSDILFANSMFDEWLAKSAEEANAKPTVELPKHLTEYEMLKILDELRGQRNGESWSGLYDVLGELVQGSRGLWDIADNWPAQSAPEPTGELPELKKAFALIRSEIVRSYADSQIQGRVLWWLEQIEAKASRAK